MIGRYLLEITSPLIKAESLGKHLGFKNLYIKFEGYNPTGSQKDRISLYHVDKAYKNGFDTITVGTCGNYGASLAYFARIKGLKPVIFTPKSYTNKRASEMISRGANIVLVDGSYEDAVLMSSKIAREQGWYDANPGSSNWYYGLQAFNKIAMEITNELGKPPDSVIIPVGNGSTLTGIYLGFKELYANGVIDKLPKIIGSTTIHGNPISLAFKKRLDRVPILNKVKETKLNEPLVSMIAFDGDSALHAIRDTGGFIVEVPDYKMARYSMLTKVLEGICPLPASASVFEALEYLREHKDGIHVAVLTGRCL
jgi:threonine synthase